MKSSVMALLMLLSIQSWAVPGKVQRAVQGCTMRAFKALTGLFVGLVCMQGQLFC